MLEAYHITHKIGRKLLLTDVSLIVKPGELVAIVGANGAGKSTLLNILSRDVTPTEGQLLLDGLPMSQYSAVELARRRAVLMQHNPPAFNFRVDELVMMGRYPHFSGQPGENDRAIAAHVYKRTGISHLVNREVPTLSGGEQQRVHLARVLAQLMTTDELSRPERPMAQPKYLLLDEPTTGLDLYYQHALLEMSQALTQRGYGVVAILHDLNLVMQYADKVLLLKEGRSLAFGTSATVLTPPLILEAFGLAVTRIQQPDLAYPVLVPIRQTPTLHSTFQTH